MLIGTGAFLVALIGGVAFLMIRVMTGQTADRFSGSTSDAVFIFGVLYLVALLGGAAIAAGVWQLRYGRRNRKLALFVLGLGFMFFILGLVVQAFG